MSQSVTVVIMHIAHNASSFGGPDCMHYEQVYCTSMQVQIQLEHNTLLRAQRVLTPTTKSLMPVGVRDEEPYDRCKRYYSGTTETEEAPWDYILRLQISTAIMTCFCFAPDGFASCVGPSVTLCYGHDTIIIYIHVMFNSLTCLPCQCRAGL